MRNGVSETRFGQFASVAFRVLFENVTLLVPVATELVENWKWSPMLLVNVEPVTLTVAFVVPLASMSIPSPAAA